MEYSLDSYKRNTAVLPYCLTTIQGYDTICRSQSPVLNTLNEQLDFWYYEMGVNIIPFDTVNKTPILAEWKPFQTKPIEPVLFEYWKKMKMFDSGARVILGRAWRKKGFVGEDKKLEYWLGCIDCDSADAINELGLLENLKKQFLVEGHINTLGKYHMFFYTTKPIQSRNLVIENGKCLFEVRGGDDNHLMDVSPSMHRDGSPWTEVDWTTRTPFIDKDGESITKWLTGIFDKHNQSYKYDSKGLLGISATGTKTADISRIGKPKIREGNRHKELLSLGNSVASRLSDILPKEKIVKIIQLLNQMECE